MLVLDADQSISEQDVRILQTVREAGRALVIAFNKWDLVDEERRHYLEREIERELVQVQWAPRINVTARTGWHVDRLVPALDKAIEGWETRISTGALNSFLGRLVAEHPHPVRSGKQPKVLFATQAGTAPPTFVLFTSGKLDAAYERYIERRLREEFGFVGTPDRAHPAAPREAEAVVTASPEARDPRGVQSATHWENVYASKGREHVSWYEERPTHVDRAADVGRRSSPRHRRRRRQTPPCRTPCSTRGSSTSRCSTCR